ncbi:MAG: hypothetical protein HS111_12840 [Kofleriaceae bacterium]|nr:hypothetical protein [Kofleriaceae bacterium]MCL4224248.1 hypothetical protein [Myxococcales bacterium]
MPDVPDIAAAIDELAGRFLGRHGIVAISDGEANGQEVIEVFVSGDEAEARAALPPQVSGFPIKVRRGGRLAPQVGP